MVIAGCLAPAIGSAPAAANPVKSLYTTVDLKICKQVKRHRDRRKARHGERFLAQALRSRFRPPDG